jgi:hypothetical protein
MHLRPDAPYETCASPRESRATERQPGIRMPRRTLTPRVREALRQLAAGPQDMRDDALLQVINDEMKKLPVDEIEYVRDRVRFSCPPCPTVQSVVLMLTGLIEVKSLGL